MEPDFKSISEEIRERGLSLSEEQIQMAAKFGEILYQENKSQNLTRIVGVGEFVDGHLIDVIEALSLPTLGQRVLDIGSGSGVPGLLAAAVGFEQNRVWFLTDSEKSKAEYLNTAKERLGLSRVSIFAKRAEAVIDLVKPDTVIARAVGTVDKIAAWIWDCSTWNNLILFKSRGWEAEWEEAKKTRFGKKLTVSHTHEYSTEGKTRILVTLKRK
jgi:16S rRNA (guanine527-N7)-methyltransferase